MAAAAAAGGQWREAQAAETGGCSCRRKGMYVGLGVASLRETSFRWLRRERHFLFIVRAKEENADLFQVCLQ